MFTLPRLPFAQDALAPHLSDETFSYHHGKHHKAYVDKLNGLVEGTAMAELELDALINKVHGDDAPKAKKIFNNAAQHWNHSFFWRSLSADGGGTPPKALHDAMLRDFGGLPDFRTAFAEAAVNHFGSGWAWLVFDKGKLSIMTTHDADLPLVHGKIALLTCDLWEHAYYVDYRNERPKYVDAFLTHLANWDFAEANLQAAA